MTKAHKATNQEQFLLRRKMAVEGLGEDQWDGLIHDLNRHPCVDFAERKPNGTDQGLRWPIENRMVDPAQIGLVPGYRRQRPGKCQA